MRASWSPDVMRNARRKRLPHCLAWTWWSEIPISIRLAEIVELAQISARPPEIHTRTSSPLRERLQPTTQVPSTGQHFEAGAKAGPVYVSDIFAHTELLAAPVFDAANERTRPNLKIQDGCDNRCSFCVIPYVRGQSRSLAPERILREVNTLVDAGYREVVISGINLGRWGRDLRPNVGSARDVATWLL